MARLAARGVPRTRIRLIPNWADSDAIRPVAHADNPFRRQIVGTERDPFIVVYSGNLGRAHDLPAVQAYHLDVDPDPGVVPWLGSRRGTIHEGWGDLTIQGLMAAASDAGRLIKP